MKHKLLSIALVTTILLITPILTQAGQGRVLPLPEGINKLVQPLAKKVNIGIMVQSMRTGEVLYQKNANRLFTPASIQKLFTTATALYYLKPSFRFKTSIASNDNNLYFKFSGDPTLKVKDLQTMVAELKSRGVNKIKGHVYIDNLDYNQVPYPPGYIWDDLSYSYGAPLNAIIINHNKFLIRFRPAKTAGSKPIIKPRLLPGVIRIYNKMRTTTEYVKDCPITIYSDMENHYHFAGCLDKRWGIQRRKLALRNMFIYAQVLIRDLLRKNNIALSGPVLVHKTPGGVKPLVVHYSKPLSKVVRKILKDSDNLATSTLLKKLGQRFYRTQGGWQNGLRAMKKILAPVTKINFKQNLLTDAAGLSRYNLFTPRQMAHLLYFIYHNPNVKPGILAALPIAGKDGTLEDRMISEGTSERIHAKTGSMTGVAALAGYITTKRNGVVSFVIVLNNFVGKRVPFIRLEDSICKFIVNAKRDTNDNGQVRRNRQPRHA